MFDFKLPPPPTKKAKAIRALSLVIGILAFVTFAMKGWNSTMSWFWYIAMIIFIPAILGFFGLAPYMFIYASTEPTEE